MFVYSRDLSERNFSYMQEKAIGYIEFFFNCSCCTVIHGHVLVYWRSTDHKHVVISARHLPLLSDAWSLCCFLRNTGYLNRGYM